MTQKLPKIDPLPLHVAAIPDGNRRWAKERGLNPWIGHLHGSKAIQKVFKTAFDYEIRYFSVWIASRDNILKRDAQEVHYLLKLFEDNFNDLAQHKMIHGKKVRIQVFGDWQELCPEGLQNAVQKAIDATAKYDKFHLNFYLGYSGTKEMLDCFKSIAKKLKHNPDLSITPELVKQNLYTKDMPPVDLVVRTGGEPHISDGFMMWDTANSQYVFSPKYWPDFKEKELVSALKEYSHRERRLGA